MIMCSGAAAVESLAAPFALKLRFEKANHLVPITDPVGMSFGDLERVVRQKIGSLFVDSFQVRCKIDEDESIVVSTDEDLRKALQRAKSLNYSSLCLDVEQLCLHPENSNVACSLAR